MGWALGGDRWLTLYSIVDVAGVEPVMVYAQGVLEILHGVVPPTGHKDRLPHTLDHLHEVLPRRRDVWEGLLVHPEEGRCDVVPEGVVQEVGVPGWEKKPSLGSGRETEGGEARSGPTNPCGREGFEGNSPSSR